MSAISGQLLSFQLVCEALWIAGHAITSRVGSGQSRRFDSQPATSGLPRSTDIARPAGLVRFVPVTDIDD
jgi:hypothetical protein